MLRGDASSPEAAGASSAALATTSRGRRDAAAAVVGTRGGRAASSRCSDSEEDEDAWSREDDGYATPPRLPGPSSCDVSRDDDDDDEAGPHPAPALPRDRPAGADVTGERRQRRMRCCEPVASSAAADRRGGSSGHEAGPAAAAAAAGRRAMPSGLMKPLVVLAFPGMYLVYKITEFKRQQQEHNRRKVTERELAHLNHKIDKLLTKLEEHEPELATSQEEECVVCVTAKASMQTFPCGHRVVCRKCFVKTIQVAVSQRVLPLRCVICRTKIVRLKHSSHGHATPVTPGARALLAPCEALGQTRPANPWPQDLRGPVDPLPASHYRHSAEACRFHRHRSSGASTFTLASPEAASASSSSSISIGRRISSPQPTSSGASSPTSSCPASPEDAPEVPRGRRSGLTRAVVHPPPPVRSPPTQPPKAACPPPPLPARSPRTPVPESPIGTPEKEVTKSMTPPPKTPAAAKTKSPDGSPKERSAPAPAKTSPDRSAPPRLQPPPPVKSPSSPTAPSTTANNVGAALCPAALSSVLLAPPPAEVRSRRGGQHRVSPAGSSTAPTLLPLTVRPPPPKPRPPSRFERFRDQHVRRPTLLLPIPEKEESEALLEAAFCRVAPGSSDLLVSASSPKIVLQDRAPLLQPDSPDRRRTSLRSQLRSKMAGFPSLLGSPLRALRAGARHRRVPDVN
ncbi:uncharacterized protein [Dermacentor andersoni]|uniref:uncharacterized protein n=1 Tax=Dermacentor andersoni TaxID=34620 RepID=UPI0024178D9A|nr:uncharacterized protein LOC126541236 [Dermacentor andersoni]